MTTNQRFWIALVLSFVVAYLGWSAPTYRMPMDYDAMISRSIPFAIVWCLLVAVCIWRYKKRGFGLLLGYPSHFIGRSGCSSTTFHHASTRTIACDATRLRSPEKRVIGSWDSGKSHIPRRRVGSQGLKMVRKSSGNRSTRINISELITTR